MTGDVRLGLVIVLGSGAAVMQVQRASQRCQFSLRAYSEVRRRTQQCLPWGIWELESGRLRLCWGKRNSGMRPTRFASTQDNGWQLLDLKASHEPEPA